MKNLTATICLTLAVLLGSAGVSWSADFRYDMKKKWEFKGEFSNIFDIGHAYNPHPDFEKGLEAYFKNNYAAAHRVWSNLAKEGDAASQYRLANLYANGQGVPKDYKTAEKWYTNAAAQGAANAQYALGRMYELEEVIPPQHKSTDFWYTLAAEQGWFPAMCCMSDRYFKIKNVVDKNIWKRVEQGDAIAHYRLSTMYLGYGEEETRNIVLAYMWGDIAASNGEIKGRVLIDILAKYITAADISTAQKLARECVRKKYKGC